MQRAPHLGRHCPPDPLSVPAHANTRTEQSSGLFFSRYASTGRPHEPSLAAAIMETKLI